MVDTRDALCCSHPLLTPYSSLPPSHFPSPLLSLPAGYASAEIEERQALDETVAEVSETNPECEEESATNVLISSPRDKYVPSSHSKEASSPSNSPPSPEDSLLVSSEDLAPTKFHPLQRFKFAMSLWRFMIPLFLVYLAEYNMQVTAPCAGARDDEPLS